MNISFNQLMKYFFLVCIILLTFSGCELQKNDEKSIKDKGHEEISFLESKLLTFFNKYAKGEYSLEDGLNWKAIDEDIVALNNVLDTIILDFSEIGLSNENIIEFRNGVDNLSIAVSNEDFNVAIVQAGNLYSLLPEYLKTCTDNANEINFMQLKSLVINSYIYANSLDWVNAKLTIQDADNKYKQMMDDVDYMKEYSYNLNKVFVLLGEMKNAIDKEELELTNMKYINFIEKI